MKRHLSLALLFGLSFLYGQSLTLVKPQEAGFDVQRLSRVDQIIEEAITKGTIPGAVLLISRDNAVVYRKAYGYRQLVPQQEPMSVNTVFDLASITKPVATAAAAMILIDRGQLRLLDRVVDYIPDFAPWQDKNDQSFKQIQVIHLLTHTSGLPPYAPVNELKQRFGSPAPDSLIQYIATVKRHHEPGTGFKYSCLNFITLQRIVETISGGSLKDFCAQNIFEPLGMVNTTFSPGRENVSDCAATEYLEQKDLLIGMVHDPLARVMMGGVSGNAGLFSTADDLARFAAMMLNNGTFNEQTVLSPAAVKAMTHVPRGYEAFGRSLGWDIYSDYSSNMGDLFSETAYGHTGYTGTSLVIDPESRTAVILLTNRVHPGDKGSVVRLRSLVANIVAGAIIK